MASDGKCQYNSNTSGDRDSQTLTDLMQIQRQLQIQLKNLLQLHPPRDNTIQTATGRENHKRYEKRDTNIISDTICVIQIQVSIQFTIFHGKVMNCALICFQI